jgi:hypothetical protein
VAWSLAVDATLVDDLRPTGRHCSFCDWKLCPHHRASPVRWRQEKVGPAGNKTFGPVLGAAGIEGASSHQPSKRLKIESTARYIGIEIDNAVSIVK